MRLKIVPLLIFILSSVCAVSAQNYSNIQQPPLDPMAAIAVELTSISKSVALLSERMKGFVDKFEKAGGVTLTEKQQRFIMGLEILVRSEQRLTTLQRAHADLLEKHIQVKARLSQIDLDLRPQSIERTTQFEGSTQTVEIRETRREKLLIEQRSLTQLIGQIERNLADADMAAREAHMHVQRLRRTLLPQIEREIGEGF